MAGLQGLPVPRRPLKAVRDGRQGMIRVVNYFIRISKVLVFVQS